MKKRKMRQAMRRMREAISALVEENDKTRSRMAQAEFARMASENSARALTAECDALKAHMAVAQCEVGHARSQQQKTVAPLAESMFGPCIDANNLRVNAVLSAADEWERDYLACTNNVHLMSVQRLRTAVAALRATRPATDPATIGPEVQQ